MPPKKRSGSASKTPKRSTGFVLPYASDEDYLLGKEFLDDPKAFLRRHKLRVRDLDCHPRIHAAIERGEAFGDAVFALGGTGTDFKMLAPVKKLASEHFGKDYEVALIPYGLRFREKLNPSSFQDGVTATGSGTITFCDKDADVDG